MNVILRQDIEKQIVRACAELWIGKGYSISIDDGESICLIKSEDIDTVMGAIMSADDDAMIISAPDGTYYATINFIYGNDGWDVIHDSSSFPEFSEAMAPIDALIERLQEQYV